MDGNRRPCATILSVMTSRILRALGASLALLAIGVAPAFAQDPPPKPKPQGFAKEGMYVGVAGLPNFALDGVTFDGRTLYREIGGPEVAILPKLDSGPMFRIVTGFRARPAALELSYERRSHVASFLDIPGTAAFNAFNVDAKIFFRTEDRIQPHVAVGFAFPWLSVHNGSFSNDTETAEVDDANFTGPAANFEAGVTVFATNRIGFSVGYHYRYIWFTNYRGVGEKEFKLVPWFGERTNSAIVMGFYTF